MKTYFVATVLAFSSTQAFAIAPEACSQWVRTNIQSFSICGGEESVKSAHCKATPKGFTCVANVTAYASSECRVEIKLDEDCYRNRSARILQDGREDI